VSRKPELFMLMMMAATLPGCGGMKPVAGGTEGTLKVAGQLLSDIQVTVHQVEGGSTRPVGFGTTIADGTFKLVTNGAQGPLWLNAGEYRFTLESAGAPVQFPKDYAHADTTPLKLTWADGGSHLELEVPTATIQ
jgi:hypothetical protein